MKIIVPMAGRGSRLRPHTLTVPKPLTPIVGKPVVQRLLEDIAEIQQQQIEDIGFIIGDFGDQTEKELLSIAEKLGARGHIFYQDVPLGTAHAIQCAKDLLDGPVVLAFADTLFRADFELDSTVDGVIWTKKVEDPSAFGVVKMDEQGIITDFVEKPQEFVSDEAIIGIYYVKDGNNLRNEIQYLLDNKITHKGEYSITDALENMKLKGLRFKTGVVDEWMDCGNKEVVIETNTKILGFVDGKEDLIAKDVELNNSRIIPPCSIGKNTKLHNCTVGPNVSIGENCHLENVEISDSIVMNSSTVKSINLKNSMIGNHAIVNGKWTSISVGDYTIMD
ncbi:MAG: nucleotidyltransferase [Flavobacteriales bacterium]|nr:MAG: nucleotidyltransferase [Flavobacteriales bacterium]